LPAIPCSEKPAPRKRGGQVCPLKYSHPLRLRPARFRGGALVAKLARVSGSLAG